MKKTIFGRWATQALAVPALSFFTIVASAYGSATSPLDDESGERFLEFWNLVFMQYNRTSKMAN